MSYESKTAIYFSTCILYQLIEDVPEENATCKLDCRRVQCTEREWLACRRLLHRSGGESMPGREFCRSSAPNPGFSKLERGPCRSCCEIVEMETKEPSDIIIALRERATTSRQSLDVVPCG